MELETGIYYIPDKIVESILRGYSPEKDNIYNVISNKKRQEIIRFCYKHKRSITEIQKHLGLSYNPTWKHVNILIEKKLVIATPTTDERGSIVYIETIQPGKLDREFKKINKKYKHLIPKRK